MNYGEFLFCHTKFHIGSANSLCTMFMALVMSFLFSTMWIHVNARNVVSLPFGTCLLIL